MDLGFVLLPSIMRILSSWTHKPWIKKIRFTVKSKKLFIHILFTTKYFKIFNLFVKSGRKSISIFPISIFQVFSQVDILFSIGGKYYTGEPITYTYMEDKIFETSRNITIKLHHRVGKYVKLRLHFSDRWIMISEVTFDSGELIDKNNYHFYSRHNVMAGTQLPTKILNSCESFWINEHAKHAIPVPWCIAQYSSNRFVSQSEVLNGQTNVYRRKLFEKLGRKICFCDAHTLIAYLFL